MTALLVEISILCVRAGYGIWMESNGFKLLYYLWCAISVLKLDAKYNSQVMAPNTHCSLFPISHLCVLTRPSRKLKVIYERSAYWMTAIQLETFLEWFRVASDIWLESYGPRHALVVLWYNIVCVYCKLMHTSWFNMQLHVCMTTQLAYLMTAYYTPNDGFIANNASFYMYKSQGS